MKLKSELLRGLSAILLLISLTPGADMHWGGFRFSQLSVFQSIGKSASGEVSWNPYFRLSDRFAIRGNLGGAVLKGISENFVAADYEVLLSFSLSKALAIEAGGGMQSWFQKAGGTSPVFSAGATWMFLLGRHAGLNAGYSLFLPSGNSTNEIKLGAAFDF